MLGSLRSMSYLKPKSRWKRLMNCLQRTQKATIEEQYEKHGVRAFDIHIFFENGNGRAFVKYGNIDYSTFSVFEFLSFLDRKGDCFVRLVLEESYGIIEAERRFVDYCNLVTAMFPSIVFFGGYRQFDFKRLHDFGNQHPHGLKFFKNVHKAK